MEEMEEYEPTYEMMIKERLMNIADLMGLDWDSYDCELNFTIKDDDVK